MHICVRHQELHTVMEVGTGVQMNILVVSEALLWRYRIPSQLLTLP